MEISLAALYELRMTNGTLYYPKNLRNDILLTGAGFTASVGGYLAQEMWAKIFNHPALSKCPNVKRLMRHRSYKFDYERIYHEVVVSGQNVFVPTEGEAPLNLEPDAANAVAKAMDEALASLVTKTMNHREYHRMLNVLQLKALIKFFSGDSNTHGLIFSTNQDIFMEALCRQGHNTNKHMVWHPGLQKYTYGDDITLPESDAELIERVTPQKFTEHSLAYCKLHGSIHWSRGGTGKPVHVTGVNKLDAIQQEPLLRWYYELFKRALNRADVRLLVIGYGFNDRHINDVIRNAIKEHGLKVHIIDPRSPDQFNASFVHPKGEHNTRLDHQEIWDGVEMYLPYTVQQVFPPPASPAVETMINRSPAEDLNRIFNFTEYYKEPHVRFPLTD